MSALAFLTGLFTLGLPAAVLLRVNGFSEDSRRGRRRKAKAGRAGGRRVAD